MTPDLHTKTYAERSALGGIGVQGISTTHGGTQYSSIHASAKTNKNMMALTIGSTAQGNMFGPSGANNGS
jgi:hypothetical protein